MAVKPRGEVGEADVDLKVIKLSSDSLSTALEGHRT